MQKKALQIAFCAAISQTFRKLRKPWLWRTC